MDKQFLQNPSLISSTRQPFFRSQEHPQMMENQSAVLPSMAPSRSFSYINPKELSTRSINTHKKSHRSIISQPTAYDNEHNCSHLSQGVHNNYEAIERILKNQNFNLKKQNELLLGQIQRLKVSNRKYKDTCLSQRIELQALKEECQVQKKRADQMKEIIMSRLASLESKALGTSQGLSLEERQELINALSLSQSQNIEQ